MILLELVLASNSFFTWVMPIACGCACGCVCVASENQAFGFLYIVVLRAHDLFGLRQRSRALAWSNTGSPRFTDFPSNLADLIG